MPLTISKDSLYQLLFILCVVTSFFPNYELTFVVWTFSLLLSVKKKYSLTIVKYITVFAIILFIAIISSLFSQPKLFLFIRDFTYLVKPILGLLIGYQLCKSNSNIALKGFVYAGLIVSLMHLSLILYAFLELKTLNVNLLRERGGYFSDYEIFALIVLIFHEKFNLSISKRNIQIITLVIGFSSFLYLSRTNFIQFGILYAGLKGYLKLNQKSLKVILITVLVTVIGYTAIVYSNPKRQGKGIEAFLYKIKIAPEEAFKTKINKDDWRDFNDNYRSFENIITAHQVSSNGWRAVIFGEGLGSRLNLGQKVWSNDHEFIQFIPIVHNAYMTVFMKSGLVGVFFNICFIVILFRQSKSSLKSVNTVNLLLIGTSVFLIVSNWVFLGLYLKLDNKSIIIGFLIAYRELLIRENNLKIIENE